MCRISVPQSWMCWHLMMCVSWQRVRTSWVVKEILSEFFPLMLPPGTFASLSNRATSISSSTNGNRNTGLAGAKVCVCIAPCCDLYLCLSLCSYPFWHFCTLFRYQSTEGFVWEEGAPGEPGRFCSSRKYWWECNRTAVFQQTLVIIGYTIGIRGLGYNTYRKVLYEPWNPVMWWIKVIKVN